MITPQFTIAAKSLPLLLLLILLAPGRKAEADTNYVPLLNGKNFEGFEILQRSAGEEEAKLVYLYGENGELHLFRDLPDKTGVETNKNATHGMLYSKKSYSRYSLKFEYKWGKKLVNNFKSYQYDSGLLYHIQDLKIWPKALQYQIRYNHLKGRNHSGDFVASGIEMQWYSKDGKTFELPALGGTAQPIRKGQHYVHKDAKAHGLEDEWTSCEVIVMGDKWAIHKLGGKVVNLATDLGVSEGPIAFEAETAEILWRNVMIKEFETDLPLELFLKQE